MGTISSTFLLCSDNWHSMIKSIASFFSKDSVVFDGHTVDQLKRLRDNVWYSKTIANWGIASSLDLFQRFNLNLSYDEVEHKWPEEWQILQKYEVPIKSLFSTPSAVHLLRLAVDKSTHEMKHYPSCWWEPSNTKTPNNYYCLFDRFWDFRAFAARWYQKNNGAIHADPRGKKSKFFRFKSTIRYMIRADEARKMLEQNNSKISAQMLLAIAAYAAKSEPDDDVNEDTASNIASNHSLSSQEYFRCVTGRSIHDGAVVHISSEKVELWKKPRAINLRSRGNRQNESENWRTSAQASVPEKAGRFRFARKAIVRSKAQNRASPCRSDHRRYDSDWSHGKPKNGAHLAHKIEFQTRSIFARRVGTGGAR